MNVVLLHVWLRDEILPAYSCEDFADLQGIISIKDYMEVISFHCIPAYLMVTVYFRFPLLVALSSTVRLMLK